MPKHSSTAITSAKDAHDGVGEDALFAWLPLLAKAEDMEEEPLRYSSPPCYLAEFSDVDGTAK
ncbi:MAG: hypothetical protein K9N47_19445 [Prosthecobacter sp.]|uniref:hypothetical protein n=1 Tax=Prosthecobacter sp. TaxID=1965333 RepID=UPI0025FE7EE4|nr:hypothetical protein [Prosthecobacter sp.]MCF7788307.1 hypothetical protein [Prosthecobacter sp.]